MKAYHKEETEVLGELLATKNGLEAGEAASRLEKHGRNQLAEGKKKSLPQRLWGQVKDPMVLILIASAVLSGVFGEIADMCIILLVVVLNAVLGIVQESKAEKAIEALRGMSAPHTKVRRAGAVAVVKSEELVPGDIVLLEAGDSVPADLRIIEAASLKIEEAALTGESVPVEKSTDIIPETKDEVSLGDRTNMAFMGTGVVYGRGEGVVVKTGMDTEMGKIASILSNTADEITPLQQRLNSLSKILSIGVLGICAFIFVFSVFTGGGFEGADVFGAFLTSVSLAVAAIPEGLVVVVTVMLSIGVTKMSKRGAIIRRMTAVETLGCTEVICSDKTGTLTQNKMTVVDSWGDEKTLAAAMGSCNDAQQDESGKLLGDPTETALYAYALKQGAVRGSRIGEAPFDSVRKMMSTLHESGSGIIQYTKGAPDEVLRNSTHVLIDGKAERLDDTLRARILQENKRMADKALRVLAAALRYHDSAPDCSPEKIERDMIFVGLAGMIDPVRPEVKDAIVKCNEAGVRAVMITGDHKDTATAIALDLGIITDPSQAVTGAELSAMSDEEFEKRIGSIAVYARVQPEHKVRIVNMWKKKGKITAMTGDGVNDAPALKSADIGVGMGITGTDVTKNVADMVLSDDNFATIICAVEEGRRIYENIRKAIQYLLGTNLAEVSAIFVATLLGKQLFAPIHILWINLVTDMFPALALGLEEAESDTMKRKPRSAKETILSGGLGVQCIWQGLVMGGLTLFSFFVGNAHSHVTGMTMAFLTLSVLEIVYAVNMRSRLKPILSIKKVNVFMIGAVILSFILTIGVIYIPGLNGLFALEALALGDFLKAVGIGLIIMPVVEINKLITLKIAKK